MTSNVASTEEVFKKVCTYVEQVMQLVLPGTQRAFSRKVTQDIDGLTVEAVVQCNVQLVKKTFTDDSKLMIQMIYRPKWLQIDFDVKLK